MCMSLSLMYFLPLVPQSWNFLKLRNSHNSGSKNNVNTISTFNFESGHNRSFRLPLPEKPSTTLLTKIPVYTERSENLETIERFKIWGEMKFQQSWIYFPTSSDGVLFSDFCVLNCVKYFFRIKLCKILRKIPHMLSRSTADSFFVTASGCSQFTNGMVNNFMTLNESKQYEQIMNDKSELKWDYGLLPSSQ